MQTMVFNKTRYYRVGKNWVREANQSTSFQKVEYDVPSLAEIQRSKDSISSVSPPEFGIRIK